ncbi:hypothetical protein ACQY0O_007984 [Thecaphora frezii]
MTAVLAASAYHTILLHLSKHPTATVLGFLLGPSNSTSDQTDVRTALPLSHHWTALAPVAEVGLALATNYAESQGLEVVGVYEAPRDVTERNPSTQALRLAEKVASLSKRSHATLLLVNNFTLLDPTTHSLLPFSVSAPSSSATKGTALPDAIPKSQSLADSSLRFDGANQVADVVKAAEAKIRQRAWKHVVDLDDHLEDPSLNWLVQSASVGA